MNEQQNEWKVVRTKEWAAQTAEIAKLRAEVPALDANSKYWFDMNKAAAAELAMVKALLAAAQAARPVSASPFVEQLFNTKKQELAGALAANAVLKDDNSRQADTIRSLQGDNKYLLNTVQNYRAAFIDLKYRHASSSSKIANLTGIIAQKEKALDIRNRELEVKNDALGNAQAELKQYKARNECATAALQGKEGQYQLQEVAKPKPASRPLPYMGIDWAGPPSYVVPSWPDPVTRGVRA